MRPCPADAWGDRFLRVDRATVEAATDLPSAVEALTSLATAVAAAAPRRLAEAALDRRAAKAAPEQRLAADPVDVRPLASTILQVERHMHPLQLGNPLTFPQCPAVEAVMLRFTSPSLRPCQPIDTMTMRS
jgi:hypothetical protein